VTSVVRDGGVESAVQQRIHGEHDPLRREDEPKQNRDIHDVGDRSSQQAGVGSG
jgi:hypothetical protein